MPSDYVRFGSENPLTPASVDPVNSCVGNIFFNPNGIDGSRMETQACPEFMGQRCAKSWDDMCSAYLTGSNTDQGGFLHLNKQFLQETAKKKYCRMSNAPGTHCAKKCGKFIPQGQSSVDICETFGTMNWLDTKDEYDLAGNFPQSSRLNPISPLYMSYCPEVCDASNPMPPDALGPEDPVLNYCIQYGTCEQVLMDLAYNLVANNQESRVSNPGFKKIIEAAKLDQPINPNVVAKIATTYGLPADVAMDVLRGAKEGGVSNDVRAEVLSIVQAPGSDIIELPGSSPASATMKSMHPAMPESKTDMEMKPRRVVSPMAKPQIVVSPTIAKSKPVKHSSKREGFYPQKMSGKQVAGSIALLAVIILVIWLVFKRR